MRIGIGRVALTLTVVGIPLWILYTCHEMDNETLLRGTGTVVMTGVKTDSFVTQGAYLERVSMWVEPEGTHDIVLPYPTNPLGLELTWRSRPREGVYTIVEHSILKCAKSDTVRQVANSATALLDRGHSGTVGPVFIGRAGTVTLRRVGRHGLDGTADIDMCPMSNAQGAPLVHVHATFALR